MSDDFFIPEKRLLALKATPAGRSGEGGYNYQRAYAVARLAAMRTTQTLLGLADHPKLLRYDWADDLDELLGDGSVCFTQCKRMDDIGASAKLAEVLSGFAPKWLWTPEPKRAQVRFRLVSCDPRFAHGFKKDAAGTEACAHFSSQLATVPSQQSDRAKWQLEADSIGHKRLFDALWQSLELVYVAKDVISNDPAGALLPAERAALNHLMQWNVIWGNTQADALARLRRLLHENLVKFDPADQTEPAVLNTRPHTIDPAEVRLALFAKEKDAPPLPFTVVDRIHLADARAVERRRYLFEPPEWHHVVHGADEQLKFIERDQTGALAKDVREQLIAPLRRGTGSLPALFVTGPPGAGKSTLVRRVAAQLVEAGEVVVADAGHNLTGIVPGGVEPYVQQLTRLAQQGFPVLLVLDDPLSVESEWIDLLRHLKQPSLQLAVLSPTPDFLYHSHEHQLRGVQVCTFPVSPPSAAEKEAIARFYGHALNESETLPDDFLVMVAEAAEGKPFPEIMQRLWETLNGGQGIPGNVAFKDLPWPVRAFWLVSALHRTYTPCPIPILQAVLAQSGGTDGLDVPTSLAKLKAQGGWRVFRVFQPADVFWESGGELVSSAHQKIASVAFEKRPGSWLDGEVIQLLAEATLRSPLSLAYVAVAAGTLTKFKVNPDDRLAKELMRQWIEAAATERSVETRNLCSLSANLQIAGGRELVQPMFPSLLQRATGNDGWLAALQLYNISADKGQERSFPKSIDPNRLIADADFSIAPNRATQFFNAVGKSSPYTVIVSRLCASLDGKLDWQINGSLLSWLLSHARQSEIVCRLDVLQQWLVDHDDDAYVRAPFMAFIQRLPKEQRFDQLREQTATETAKWLADHDDDTYVRTQYLAFIPQLPKEMRFDQLREQAATETAKWLARHEENADVRTQFLAFIQRLPKEKPFDQLREQAATETAKWLARHEENADVRTQFLAFIQRLPKEKPFDQLREQAATETAKWLARHEENADVRTQYLAFIRQLPSEFDEMRKQTGLKTSEWLKMHPENYDVCIGYLSFLLDVRHPDLAALEAESILYHQWIIAKDPAAVGNHFVFGEQLLRLEKFAEAKVEFELVVAREPQHQLAHRGLAIALQNLGKPKEAEDAFKRGLHWARAKGGKLARFHTSLGLFYLSQNRWTEAIKSFEEAGEESSEYYGNHWGIAKAQRELGRLREAKQSLERALALPGLRSPAKEEIEETLADISQQISASAGGRLSTE
jgi:tetratricopeptide (TPR) repeat protein